MAEISEIHELLESVRVTLSSSMNPNREELDRLHSELDGEIRGKRFPAEIIRKPFV